MSYKPSYREKQEQKKNIMLAAGLISDRFPGVSNIACKLTYYQRTVDPILMERTINFSPSSYALLHMNCLRDGCAEGGFDLTPVINGLVKGRKTSGTGRIPCHGTRHSLDPGHAVLAYRVNIEYRS
ncbi:MAG: hypothetical protein OEW15_13670 [Nitrospirota bacterium]|nr:hypothetical protein [Nitrospirota bacterium]